MDDTRKSFGKVSLILLLLAGLAFGALIGGGLASNEDVSIAESASVPPAPVDRGGAPVFRYLGVGDVTPVTDEFDIPLPAVDGENFIGRVTILNSETLTIELAADEAIEYKAMMKQGDSIVFRWVVDGDPVYYDFHAHDASFGPEFFTRYDEGGKLARRLYCCPIRWAARLVLAQY